MLISINVDPADKVAVNNWTGYYNSPTIVVLINGELLAGEWLEPNSINSLVVRGNGYTSCSVRFGESFFTIEVTEAGADFASIKTLMECFLLASKWIKLETNTDLATWQEFFKVNEGLMVYTGINTSNIPDMSFLTTRFNFLFRVVWELPAGMAVLSRNTKSLTLGDEPVNAANKVAILAMLEVTNLGRLLESLNL